MSRIYFSVLLTILVSCTKTTSSSDSKSAASMNLPPCSSDATTYCSNERGYMSYVCLTKIPKESLTERCKKHLEEFPVRVRALEDKFVEVCKPFFKGCEGTEGETRFHRQWRRECIVNKIKTVSPECKNALDVHLQSLPESWRPKNWTP